MTVESRPSPAPERGNGPSIHTRRARRLLRAGLTGGLVAAAGCMIGFGLGLGLRGLVSAALAAAMVLFFYAVGQYVMVRSADSDARTLLMVSMFSYAARVMVLGILLLIYDALRADVQQLAPMAVFVTTMAVVAGWLIVEVIVFSRLRIGAFDTEYEDPRHAESGQ